MPVLRLPIRAFAEFLCAGGSIDSRFGGFERAAEGARIHRKLQKEAGEGYEPEVFLKGSFFAEDYELVLEGRADGIFTDDFGIVCIDEIKTVSSPPESITEDYKPEHWAQGKLYACLYCRDAGLEKIGVRLTYYQTDTGMIIRYSKQFTAAELENFAQALAEQYLPWAKRKDSWLCIRNKSLNDLHFPFSTYRPGQYSMAGAVYRTFRDKKRLLCCAPTGIGKTMSCLFPALKSLGTDCGERVFYLTARNTQGAAAEDALKLMRKANSEVRLKSITLTAKDRICFLEHRECTPEACPYANGYYDRVRSALWEALEKDLFDRAELEQLGKTYTLCPFELGLDISEWCDVIIGDYNYLFDPTVRLKRFFEQDTDALILVDEAHELPDRARDIYSARLCTEQLRNAKKPLGRARKGAPEAMRKLLLELESLSDDSDPSGTVFLASPPESLSLQITRTLESLQRWLDKNKHAQGHDIVLEFYFELRSFSRVLSEYDEHYVTQLVRRGKQSELSLLCLDPSDRISQSLNLGRGSVLFSATLTPFSYFAGLFGSQNAPQLQLPSPFPKDNLFIAIGADVCTKYSHREESIPRLAQYLLQMTESHIGNYLACFPSYAYLNKVREYLEETVPDLSLLVQTPEMSDGEKNDFLCRFKESPAESMLAMIVMGGIFGEGIDLTGSRLVGAAIVGVGLPQINPAQEKLKEYYDQTLGSGFDYAYRNPGMNRVLQAAGRVIRTETDKGVLLLLDERFCNFGYNRLFPPHWGTPLQLRDPAKLNKLLQNFWKK